MMVTVLHARDDLARLLDLCAESLRIGYASQGGATAALVGATVLLGLTSRIVWCSASTLLNDHRVRKAHVAALNLLGDRTRLPGALVLHHDAPYAFCIGGRRNRVVVTTGLLETLDTHELDAVMAHEHAHLRQRHHLALLGCRIVFGTLAPMFPAFKRAMVNVRLYVELCADDCARMRVGVRPLRSALVTLANGSAPAGALAASGIDVATRIRRLEQGPQPLKTVSRLGAGLGLAALVAVPMTLVAAPVLTMVWEAICLVGW